MHEDAAAELKVFPLILTTRSLWSGISRYSVSANTMLPFTGVAHIAYVPRDGRVVGLSKLARIADIYARRLQVQERLTTQIAELLYHGDLRPKGVMVVIEAMHLCMIMRGVKKPGATTITSEVRGVFRSDERTRIEAIRFSRKIAVVEDERRAMTTDISVQSLRRGPANCRLHYEAGFRHFPRPA